jgi:hypothetical protein
MRPSLKLVIPTVWWMLSTGTPVMAQGEAPQSAEVPNWMAAHTWFILIAFGALLAWCISYSLQLQKEALMRRKGRDEVIRRKDAILDQIAELEERKEGGDLSETKYKKELKDLKTQLSRVIEQLGLR